MIDDPPHIIFTNHTPQGDVGANFLGILCLDDRQVITPRKGTLDLTHYLFQCLTLER